MRKSICVALALSSLSGLSACGQSQINPAAAYGAAPQYAQNVMQQNPYSYQNPGQQAFNPTLTSPASFSQAPQQQQRQTYPQQSTHISKASTTSRTQTKTSPSLKKAPTRKSQSSVKSVPLSRSKTSKTPAKTSAVQRLIAKAVQRFKSLNSLKLTVDGFEAHSTKGPTNLTFNVTALNGQTKIEVLKHKNSLYVGVKMGYQGGVDKIAVRPGGALGFVKVNTKMSDERLLTPRGYRLDQIDAFAISKRLISGKHQPKVLGKTQINGRSVAILEYTHANDFDSSITRELLGIDMQDHFVRVHEMYKGSELVFSLKMRNIQLNTSVSPKDLEI